MNVSADTVLTMIGLILALLQLASAVMAVFQNNNLLQAVRKAVPVSVLLPMISSPNRGLTILRKSNRHKAEPTLLLNGTMFQG